jgi:DNA uptake protein ComE-like DNA-binding protein
MMKEAAMKWGRMLVVSVAVAWTATAGAQVGKGLIDPNTADEKTLLGMPHLTAPIVKGILEKRPFASQADFNAYLAGQGLARPQLAETYGKTFVHLNLNTATRDEILMIPNLGNRMAHEFEEYRPYKAMAQFRREMKKYVDDKEVARLEQYVFVPINLNTASDEDILSIPGLGNRMLHEFKEYRPYKTIEQFRREIGKYVDKKEVARLERYVTID